MERGFECGEAGVSPIAGWVKLEPAFGHAGGENGAKEVVGGVEVAAGQRAVMGGKDLCAGCRIAMWSAGCEHWLHDVEAGGEV